MPTALKSKPDGMADARQFFAQELKSVMEKRQIPIKPDAFEYLVDLMIRFLESDVFFAKNSEGKFTNNVLAEIFSQYVQGPPEVKKVALRRLGDVCMMVTGFFSDSLKRKLVDVDYYFGMGGAAYWQLSCGSLGVPMYKELSVRFKTFADVLGEMSERNNLQSNTDLLRLYERWIYTGSHRLRDLLAEHGIPVVVPIELKTRH